MNSQEKIPVFFAIMQTYVFPNINYMSLVSTSDTMVFYDDINFIKRGWINRNQIILNRLIYKLTVPLKKPSQNMAINEVELVEVPKQDHYVKTKYL
tara:strand:- start:123 stop:410 length:288 start_codon:yes stop_codon:yes gene_type:complete